MSKDTLAAVANAAQIFCKNHGKLDQLRDAIAAHDADEVGAPAPAAVTAPKRTRKAKVTA